MNNRLTFEIINHIYAELGLVNSNFVLKENLRSLKSEDYLLPDKITSETEDGEIKNNIWGIQLSIEQSNLNILFSDVSIDPHIKEYACIVHMHESPAYGMYCVYGPDINPEPMIAVTTDGESWVPCNAYLQATFLAAMESAKNNGFNWRKSQEYKNQYDILVSFIKYYGDFHGFSDEG